MAPLRNLIKVMLCQRRTNKNLFKSCVIYNYEQKDHAFIKF